MRTVVELDDDVVSAVERVSRERDIGFSEALNELVRGSQVDADAPPAGFQQRCQALGLRLDVSNIAEALEQLDGLASR
jgi:hypothetical protein